MNALTKTAAPRVAAPSTPIFQPQSFGELVQFADMAARSSMVPTAFRGKAEDIMLAVQLGSEVGLSPMQSLQGIAVINGRPAIWGDSVIGLVRQSPLCEDIIETMEGEGESLTAVCVAKRTGASPTTSRFSVADAKKAGLWNKQGPWQQYPARMLQQRARGFALRDTFADVLKGLKTVEELRDYRAPDERYDGPTIDAQPVQAAPVRASGGTVNTSATARAIDDGIPALDDDPLRDKVDWLVKRLAGLKDDQDLQYEAIVTKAPKLLAAIDEADRADLKAMAVDALAAARLRFELGATAEDPGADFDAAAAA